MPERGTEDTGTAAQGEGGWPQRMWEDESRGEGQEFTVKVRHQTLFLRNKETHSLLSRIE